MRTALRLLLLMGLALGATVGPLTPPALAADPAFDFSDWHYPVPAGKWLISRGPCGGNGLFSHDCEYFEDRCAFDLTPLDAGMDSVPVLAPQAGQVFFAGNRTDSGLSVMLRHPDGRVSALFHLSRIVVAPEARVAQGQVVGYAGSSGSSTGPHLHFDVQPNAVERSCLPLETIDEFDRRTMTIVSHNLAWPVLTLPDPPADLPGWLPLSGPLAERPLVVFPGSLLLAPGASFVVPVAVQTAAVPLGGLQFNGQRLTATDVVGEYSLFALPLTTPNTLGAYSRALALRPAAGRTTPRTALLRFTVRAAPDLSATLGMVVINPSFLAPLNYSYHTRTPQLCWSESPAAGPGPLTFRAMAVGPQAADSGWITATCWQPPPLAPGRYFWKVFVRDGQGYMIRPNQRPWTFKLRAGS
ncbi:MAG: M23 family metallopeptidase [Anaerolineales bacterium]|nr:M23 family metallopeptidase [Anaerolineales bacterium]